MGMVGNHLIIPGGTKTIDATGERWGWLGTILLFLEEPGPLMPQPTGERWGWLGTITLSLEKPVHRCQHWEVGIVGNRLIIPGGTKACHRWGMGMVGNHLIVHGGTRTNDATGEKWEWLGTSSLFLTIDAMLVWGADGREPFLNSWEHLFFTVNLAVNLQYLITSY